MKNRHRLNLTRFLSGFLIIVLALGPSSAYALRAPSPLEAAEAAGLEEKLREYPPELPLGWIADALRHRMDRDKRLLAEAQQIRLELAAMERLSGPAQRIKKEELVSRVESFRNILEEEQALFPDLARVWTDEGTAIHPFFEEAETLFFEMGTTALVPLGLVRLPFIDLKKMVSDYDVADAEDFKDDFKARFIRVLTELHPSRKSAQPLEARVASQGGRIYVLGVPVEQFGALLKEVVRKVTDEVLKAYSLKIKGKNAPQRRKEFEEKLRGLLFFSAHTQLYLNSVPAEPPLPDPSQKRLFKNALNRNKPLQIPPAEREKLEYRDRADDLRDREQWRANQRKKVSESASYWLHQDRLGVEGAREKASVLLELHLLSARKELEARLKSVGTALDPEYDPELSEMLQGETEVSEGVYLLSDEKIQKIRATLRRNKQWKRLTKLDETLENGRSETVPIANFHSGRIPRIDSRLRRFDNPRFSEKAHFSKLNTALDKLQADPSAAALAEFLAFYQEYRLEIDEALVLAPRDPRLEEAHKFYWIDHMMQAYAGGQWREFRRYLQKQLSRRLRFLRADSFGGNPNQDGEVIRLKRLVKLIPTDGALVVRRPEGDEIWTILENGEGYWIGLKELRRGGTWMRFYPPDEKDTPIHRLILGFLRVARGEIRVAHRYRHKDGVGMIKRYLEKVNEVVEKIAPNRFQAESKIEEQINVGKKEEKVSVPAASDVPADNRGERRSVPRIARRMQTHVPRGTPEGAEPEDRYARSSATGNWFHQIPWDRRWIPMKVPPGPGLKPEMARLSLTRNYYEHKLELSEVRKRAVELEQSSDDQKKDPRMDARIMSLAELKSASKGSRTNGYSAGLEERDKRTNLEGQQMVFSAAREILDGYQSGIEDRKVVVLSKSLGNRLDLQVLAGLEEQVVIQRDEPVDFAISLVEKRITHVQYFGGLEETRQFKAAANPLGIGVTAHNLEDPADVFLLHELLKGIGVPEALLASGLEELGRILNQLGQAA